MTIFRNASAAAGLAALMATAVPAFAQAPAAPAAPEINHGPAIAGMCVVDVDRVLVESSVGKAANTRLQSLTSAVQAELTAEQTSLVNDARTFETQRATLAQDAADRRDADLQVRRNALQRKAELRQAELQATQQKALERIATELDPVQAAVYQQRNCAILFTRQALIAVNPAMDITPVVITALNTRISTLTFERERLDQTPAAPQAAR
jgi:Skp family chaperone for outer membrane proteins